MSVLLEFQDKFIRKLLRLPQSTPKAILHWDVDMKLLKWRVAERKLNFVNKIMARENSNITKKVIMSEVLLKDMQNVTIKGLAHECKSLSEELSIQNVVINRVNKSTIRQATEALDKKEKRIDMENSKKVGDRLTDNPKDNTYLSEMSLLRSRIWIRHRVRMIKGVKYNIKRSYKDLSCRFCQSGEENGGEEASREERGGEE